MTALRELLREIADQAEPADDLADRALARAGRRSRQWLPMATAAAAVASVVVLVAVVLPAVDRSAEDSADRTADGVPQTSGTEISLPKEAPPLPRRGVGAASVGYQRACGHSGEACGGWRVMTPDGRHFTVADAVSDEDRAGALVVAPDGKRIAYVRQDGALVVRDLETGSTQKILTVPEGQGITQLVWSADGRWLVARQEMDCGSDNACTYDPAADVVRTSLIDTRRGGSVDLGAGEAYGVTSGESAPFPFADESSQNLRLLDHAGKPVGTLPDGLVRGTGGDGMQGEVSPDGRLMAAITFPGGTDSTSETADVLISLVDVRQRTTLRTTTVKEPWMDWSSPQFQGWTGGDVLVSTSTLAEVDRDAPGNPGNDVTVSGENVDRLDTDTMTMERVLTIKDPTVSLDVADRALSPADR